MHRIVKIAGLTAVLGISSLIQASENAQDFSFTYEMTVNDLPDTADEVIIYLPIAQSGDFQTVKSVIPSMEPSLFITDKENGDKIGVYRFKAKDIENNKIRFEYKVRRLEDNRIVEPVVEPLTAEQREKYLQPDSLVPIDGEIQAEAKSLVNDKMTEMEKARIFFDHLVATMKYDKSGTGWGRGDALYACDVRKGNCTDFHSLFIGLCRSVGIPARFTIGFPLPSDKKTGKVSGYHCWAEFYTPDKGWIPVDISEAYKHPDKREYLFGNLDNDRIEFSRGRDILVNDGTNKFKLNYFIYPYLLVDGSPSDSYSLKLHYRN